MVALDFFYVDKYVVDVQVLMVNPRSCGMATNFK